MTKLIDEFRRGWHGISQPSLLFAACFAVFCLALATAARWGLAQIRPDVFFTPYFPAVFFATAFGGYRIGMATAVVGGALGVSINFGDAVTDSARLALLLIFWAVCGLMIWVVGHYRTLVAQQRAISRRLTEEEEYRKLVVDELQHRLKNKVSTIHAVLHQVLHEQPEIWSVIDHRIRALSATDDLIARVDASGCDIKDLLRSELEDILITISLTMIFVLLCYRVFASYRPVRNEIKLTPFHFFLYLCAFEIAPLLLIYKVLLAYLEKPY